MSADVLREAAAKMRALAEAASAGPWKRFGMAGVAGRDWEVVDERRIECDGCNEPVALLGCATNDDAAYIAAMSPPVALAVADWLDETALRWEWVEERELALTVARAYLHEPTPKPPQSRRC